MPDQTPAPAPAPKQEGTSLWNIQTQSPEWVPLDQVKGKLSAGSHLAYAGSTVGVQPGIGAEGALAPEKAAVAVEGGATASHSEAFRELAARKAAHEREFDNAGDKALAVADGVVSGLSAGILQGVPAGSDYLELIREKRGDFNAGYKTVGELAALAATIFAPGSALKYTPLGATNTAFTKTSAAVNTALSTKIGSSVIRQGISDATAGAVAAGALSSGHQVGNALNGKPVSGYAIVDDIGLGAAIGLGVGMLGGAITNSAKKAGDIERQIEAAARFDESALPVRATLTDVSKSWNSAHNIAAARHDALDDLVKSGLLDAETPGIEWLAARTEAKLAADKARDKLVKLAGTDDPAAIGARLHDLAVSGKAKDAQKLYQAFDDYGTAVSRFDDAMQPTSFDNAHLGDVIGDIDMVMPASEHPLQRLEQMIKNGTPADEVERFAQEYDDLYLKNRGGATAVDDAAPKMTGAGSPGARKPEARGAVDLSTPSPTPSPRRMTRLDEARAKIERQIGKSIDDIKPGDPWSRTEINKMIQKAAEEDATKIPRQLGDDINKPDVTAAYQSLHQRGPLGNDVAGFQAKKILDQIRVERGTGVMSPMRPTVLGGKIQGLLDELTAATGNRLGSAEARALANKLGMNTASLNGPVSSTLADLWALHRMSETLGATAKGGSKRASKSLLSQALANGVASGVGTSAYHAAGTGAQGAAASGMARSLARQFLGAALYGTGMLTAAAGRFRQSAINGLAKVLTPTGRKLASLGAINTVVSSTYQPNTAPTTSYNTKSEQLRWFLQNPDPMERHLQEVFKDIGGVDPMAYTAAVDAAMSRLKNLAKALPAGGSWSVMGKRTEPTEEQKLEWQQYESITNDRELIFKYLKTGLMPETVVTAMYEQHPDFMAELRDYVLNNPEEVQNSPHNTQMALSRLLGVALVPEANPLYIQRMQEPYIEAKEKANQNQMQNTGAQALQAPMPTPAQLLVIPPLR